MKTFTLSIVALFITTLSFGQLNEVKQETAKMTTPVAAPKQSQIKWEQEMHDFGEIQKGKPVTYEFTFTNTTNETILITTVKPACGCTAANYTKTPVKPGEKGMVAATFNAAAAGQFQKSVTILTKEGDDDASKTLSFKGKVIDPAAATPESNKKLEIKS